MLAAFEEFHHYARTNAFISKNLKTPNSLIYVFAPAVTAPILSSADFVIIHESYSENLYPDILEKIGKSRNLSVYGQKLLVDILFHFVRTESIDEIVMFLGSDEDTQELNFLFDGRVKFIHSLGIPSDFEMIGDFITNGGNIYPFRSDLEKIKNLAPMALDQTALIITRNFKNKQPFYNTKNSTLHRFIIEARKQGLNVLNIGSPTLHSKIHSNNFFRKLLNLKNYKYAELNNLTYSQMLALAVSCKVWQLLPHAGGFSIHIASQANLIIDGPEFCKTSKGEWLSDLRRQRTDLITLPSLKSFEGIDLSRQLIISPKSINYDDKILDIS